MVQWVRHGAYKQEVLCSIPGGLRWCQEGRPTSNAPVHRTPVMILEIKNRVTSSRFLTKYHRVSRL